MAYQRHRRHRTGQPELQQHLGISGFFDHGSGLIPHFRDRHGKGTQVRPYQLHRVTGAELVPQGNDSVAVGVTFRDQRHHLPFPDVAGIFVVLAGITVVKAGGIGPVADVLHLVPPHRVNGAARGGIVQTVPVSAGDDGGIVGGFGPTLDLQTGQAHIQQVIQMVDHAHITGIQNIAALFVLFNGEIFAGAFFLHQGVMIAAGLSTGTAAGIPARHIIAQQTPPGIADAHGPVNKGLDLQLCRGVLPDGPNFFKAQLPG